MRSRWILLCALALPVVVGCRSTAPGLAQLSPESPEPRRDLVVLVHGLGRTERSMHALAEHLGDAGYTVERHGYPSLDATIADHGKELRRSLDRMAANPEVRHIHLVTHSMGGLVARAALGELAPEKVHRIVMLAPPNAGSPVARFMKPLLGGLIPAIAEMAEGADGSITGIPIPDTVQVGTVAARWDHVVPSDSTRLEEEVDHLNVRGFHSLLMWQDSVLEQVEAFLREGRFEDGSSDKDSLTEDPE